jgi:hypothetical protein
MVLVAATRSPTATRGRAVSGRLAPFAEVRHLEDR